MITITAHLIDTPDEQQLLEQFGLNKGGFVQSVINDAVIRECLPYVPASPGRTLEFSAISDVDNGLVIWDTPYAHYQYMGIVYGPNFLVDVNGDGILEWRSYKDRKKHPTDRELTYHTSQNPMAGSHWFERMKADHLNDILEEAQKAMNQGR